MKSVLITGSMGFLGRQCIKECTKEKFRVITTDKLHGAEFVGNLADPNFIRRLPDVDVVVNCAAVQYVTKRKPILRNAFFYTNNVISIKLLTERYGSSVHFIQIGTSMMYQNEGTDLFESSPVSANGVYSKSKIEAQKLVNKLERSATIVPCIIGGPGREGLFRPFVRMIDTSRIAIIPGDGRTPIHMVHVEDVASLIVLVIKTESTGIFNAAAPSPLTIRDWIRVIAETLGKPPPKIFALPVGLVTVLSVLTFFRLLAKEQLTMLRCRHVLDIQKSLKLGWKPKYTNLEISSQLAKYMISTYPPRGGPKV
jgi:nucleoside-diphosphate-sugar epimerase